MIPRPVLGDTGPGVFDPEAQLPGPMRHRHGEFIWLAAIAAREALAQANYRANDPKVQARSGVLVGSGIGGAPLIHDTTLVAQEKGPRGIAPWFVPAILINMAGGYLAQEHDLKGPNLAVATACATGTHAIGEAARIIQRGEADMMLAGGTEAAVNRMFLGSFGAMRALATTHNSHPQGASRPFDSARSGFVLGEGAGCMVLEAEEAAVARGATPLARIAGYGMSADAHHAIAPDPKGEGAARAMLAALDDAGRLPRDLDHINAHATGTVLGDEAELRALERLDLPAKTALTVSATKASTGHLLGAAGAIEAIFTVRSLQEQIAPPTINLDNPIHAPQGVTLIGPEPHRQTVTLALSNSFAFGGINACLLLERW